MSDEVKAKESDAAGRLKAAGLRIVAGMTTPKRPGKAARPVWSVYRVTHGFDSMLRDLGGRKYGGGFSFWEDPTERIVKALDITAPDDFAEQRDQFVERAEARAERYEGFAANAKDRSTAAYNRARKAIDGIPFGQPVLVGHHSERHHRAALSRADSAMSKSVEESKKASYLSGRADAAARNAAPNSVGFCQRRIDEAEAEIRRYEKRLLGAHGPDYIATLNLVLAEERSKVAYWTEQLGAAGGVKFGKHNVKVGDLVKVKGHDWGVVAKLNPKTVSVQSRHMPWPLKYLYAEIREHREAQSAATTTETVGV